MSASVNTIMIIAGSASDAIITSRLDPIPPKLVPTSSPASARKKRALPSSATMAMRSADQLNISPVANVGTKAAATQVPANIMIGHDAEQPRCTFRQHHLLAHESNEVAVGLDERRAAAAQEPGLRLAHKSSQQRCQQQHQQHLCALQEQFGDYGHSGEHQEKQDEHEEDQAEISTDGQELQTIELRRPQTRLPPTTGAYSASQIRSRNSTSGAPGGCRRAAASRQFRERGTRWCRTRGGWAGQSCRRYIALPGSGRESRSPRRGAPQLVRSETVDDKGREAARNRDEDENQGAVIGAAAFGDRHDREPLDARLHRHPLADEALRLPAPMHR